MLKGENVLIGWTDEGDARDFVRCDTFQILDAREEPLAGILRNATEGNQHINGPELTKILTDPNWKTLL